MKEYLVVLLKGAGMGAANVIPGVSGGTIALITGIFERLIHAIKSIDITAIRLLLKGQIRDFIRHTDLYFLISLGLGVLIALFSLARLFDFLFTNYPVFIWSYFFGLILASVYFVGKTLENRSLAVIISFLAGTVIAVFISFLSPAQGNENFFYLILCGVAGVCSMILPGLSGSFILILMGNYQLVFIEAVNELRLDILFPVAIGIVVGLIGFSHLLSWVFRKFRNQTIALLTGFILGSLLIIWPWKEEIYALDAMGEIILKNDQAVIASYSPVLPASFNEEVIIAVLLMIAGIISIWLIEWAAQKKK
jgi:putative membrane protein